MQVFDIILKAKESRVVDVQASYVYFLNGSAGGADTTVVVTPTGGGEAVYLKPGQAYQLPGAAPSSGRWTISNLRGEGTIIGQVLMGEGTFSDNRISGSVEIIDGGYSRTLAGRAFMGVASNGADAAKVTGAQVWNPLTNTRNLVVKRYTMSSAVGGGMHVRLSQQALGQTNNNGYAKNPLVPDSKAEMRVDKLDGVASYFNGNKVDQYSIPVNGSANCILQEQIIVPPGWGLLFHALAPGVDVTAALEWYEEVI